jgi:hypothetical protein
MPSKLEQYREKLLINEHSLEVELRDLPKLVDDIGQEHVLVIADRDEAKQELDEVEAKVDAEIRRDASLADEKITNPEVESQKKLNPKVKAANKKFLDLKLEASQWGVLKEAVEKRSYALSKLCDLYIANYYSDIQKKGDGDFKTLQSHRVKEELKERRKKAEL